MIPKMFNQGRLFFLGIISVVFFWQSFGISRLNAQPSTEISILKEEQEALRAAADFAQDSVVQVETFGGREVVDDAAVASGPSSGTVVDPEGWIITSMFQFRGEPASITVLTANGNRHSAKLVARDYARELALLKIDSNEPLRAVKNSPRSNWEIGQWTIALGKTFDVAVASRSVGILSAIDRIFGRAIQTDCKISPHNYGGPLVDLQGRTLGILAPIDPGIATEGEVQQWYDSGIGFAVPLDDIQARLPRLKKGEDIYPGKAGIRPELNDDFRGPVILAGVAPGTPAAKAGLKSGDQLLKINDVEIRWPNHIRHALGPIDAGQTVRMTVSRGGKEMTVECGLVKELPVYRLAFVGVAIDAAFQGKGVKVKGVLEDGPAGKAGIKPGQIITQVGKELIVDANSFDQAIAFLDYREPTTIEVGDLNEGTLEAQDVKSITVKLDTWPDEIDKAALVNLNENDAKQEDAKASKPKSEKQDDPEVATGVQSLSMGDVKNQAFVFVPPNYQKGLPHGLLVVLPEPGKVDRKTWVDRWETFARQHHWLVAVLGSANPEAWTREEVELLKRCMQEIRTKYSVDPRRIVIGGVGSGATPATVGALQNKRMVRGLWIANGGIPRGLRMPQAEPMESPSLLLQGDNPGFKLFSESLRKLGYRAVVTDEAWNLNMVVDKLIKGGLNQEQSYLASLDWF